MSSSRARHGCEVIRFDIGNSSLGNVLVAESTAGVCAVMMSDDDGELRKDLEARFPRATLIEGGTLIAGSVIEFVDSGEGNVEVPLDLRGTSFQRAVWQTLMEIPPGDPVTYTHIASLMGRPNAVRAVASACGANALAVIVPCHRVVSRDGKLAGYRWGLERKRALLEREAGRCPGGPDSIHD